MTYNLLVRLIESISASEEEGAAGDVSGMETEETHLMPLLCLSLLMTLEKAW